MYKVLIIKLIGVIFIFVSVFFYKQFKIKNSIIFFSLGLFLVYISFFGSISNSYKRIDYVKKIDYKNVLLIKIQPTRVGSLRDISLVSKEYIIYNKINIEKICKAVNESELVGDEFLKNPEKVCRIEVSFKNREKIFFGLKIDNDYACLTINSNGESGWHYGKLESKELGFLIKKIILDMQKIKKINH